MQEDVGHSRILATVQWSSRASGVAAALLGVLVLGGWAMDLEYLKDPARVIAMKPNTALVFLLLGASLALSGERASRWPRTLRGLLVSVAIATTAITAFEYLADVNLGIDELLFSDPYASFTPPGRMALITAMSFLLLALALTVLDIRMPRGQRPSEWLATIALLFPLFGASDYVLDGRPEFSGIAIHTVVGLLILGAGVLVARPQQGWVQTVISVDAGGTAARRLLPWTVFVPLTIAGLSWFGHRLGVYSVEFAASAMTCGTVAALVAAVWWNARQLNRIEEQRRRDRERAESELRRINRALATINHCREALAHAETEKQLLQDVCRVVVDDGGYRMAWVGYAEHDPGKHVAVVAHHGAAEDYAENAGITWDEAERGRGPTGAAIRSGKVQICHDVLQESRMRPWLQAAIDHGFRSTAVLPLADNGRPFGALSIYSAAAGAFHAEEIGLLAKLAEDLAYGVVSLRARVDREAAQETIERAARYARSLIEASLDPLVTISRDGRIMDVNHATELVTGYDRDHLIGSDFSDYFTDPGKARAGYKQVFAEGAVHDYELSIRHLSGPVTDVVYNATVYRNLAGEIEGVFAAARDITERKRTEQDLAQRTAELERSNRELQDFASIASHDLQEPLRKVMAFGDRLRQHAGPALDETAGDYLRRMQNAASRMSSLIESLLEYSRVTTKARPFERVNLNSLAADVLTDLEMRIQESAARVEVGSLPELLGDKLQIRQLLQNLLANALKFHAAGVPPRIRLSAMRASDESWSIAVEDHGVGFDPSYSDRLFRPFQRLHARTEFEGSGMGLAICRKIVDRHHGVITARSRPGEGTVITVTLPAMSGEEEHAYAHIEPDHDPDRRGR